MPAKHRCNAVRPLLSLAVHSSPSSGLVWRRHCGPAGSSSWKPLPSFQARCLAWNGLFLLDP